MVFSMTGYGRGEREEPWGKVTVEIKTLNHRHCDVSVRCPRELAWAEIPIRAKAQGQLRRGRIEVSVTAQWRIDQANEQVTVDNAWYIAYYRAMKDLGETLGIPALHWQSAACYQLASAMRNAEPRFAEEAVLGAVMAALDDAVAEVSASRRAEGAGIRDEILQRARHIESVLEDVARRAPAVVDEYRCKLTQRLQTLLGKPPGLGGQAGQVIVLDESRLAMEVALMAERCDVSEEISRANSHLKALAQVLNGDGEDLPGKKVEFILQEMLREVNTLSAKANDYEVSSACVDVKAELERIREQAQNLA